MAASPSSVTPLANGLTIRVAPFIVASMPRPDHAAFETDHPDSIGEQFGRGYIRLPKRLLDIRVDRADPLLVVGFRQLAVTAAARKRERCQSRDGQESAAEHRSKGLPGEAGATAGLSRA